MNAHSGAALLVWQTLPLSAMYAEEVREISAPQSQPGSAFPRFSQAKRARKTRESYFTERKVNYYIRK